MELISGSDGANTETGTVNCFHSPAFGAPPSLGRSTTGTLPPLPQRATAKKRLSSVRRTANVTEPYLRVSMGLSKTKHAAPHCFFGLSARHRVPSVGR